LDIYYLGHSGFAADTGNTLLVFDYWEDDKKLLGPVLDIQNRKIYFFSSHNHRDHYDKNIEGYKVRYEISGHFTGWDMRDDRHIFIPAYGSYEKDGMEVTAAGSNDSGAAFLVRTDGICIFHGGDLAGWEDETWKSFTSGIDHIRSLRAKIDAAFLAVTTFSGIIQKSMVKAAGYLLETLDPVCFIPMHANLKEYLYKEFKDKYFPGDKRIIYPIFPGEKMSIDL
jgi:L-ascorbate metabolism protein UlaG (beta-lactamase superfamily)